MFDKKTRLNKMLLRAAKRGDEKKALLALEKGAELDCGKAQGETPLIKAIMAGKWSMACLLVEKGADVHGAPPSQKTPLMYAVEQGDAATVRLLLDAGAAPDAAHIYSRSSTYERKNEDSGFCGFFQETSYYTRNTTYQMTALTEAARDGKSEIVRVLLAAGAGRDRHGWDRQNGIHLAEDNGHPRVAALLRAAPEPELAPTPAPPPAPAPQKSEERPGDVVFRRALGDSVLEEIYDFTLRERISLIRKSEAGPVEISTREAFEALVDTPSLRAAFDEHVRRGGTVTEKEIFASSLNKPRMTTPRNGL